jgi:hypothetical protein
MYLYLVPLEDVYISEDRFERWYPFILCLCVVKNNIDLLLFWQPVDVI